MIEKLFLLKTSLITYENIQLETDAKNATGPEISYYKKNAQTI